MMNIIHYRNGQANMKKKAIYVSLGLLILLALGLFLNRQYHLNKYHETQRERIELFFHYNYKDITSITFTGTSTTPMGSLDFEGYFNGDEDERFTATIMSHEENFEYHNVISGDFDDKHFRGETYEKLVPVSQILKEQGDKSNNDHE